MASASQRITSLVIGPQAGGRGYRVLARSDGPSISGTAEGRLNELALVIAGWAEEREAPAAALIPLTDATAPALLIRFAYLGAASLGTIAYANGLILDAAAFAACGGRPETLLHLIPEPDGSRHFAEAPPTLTAPPAAPPPRRDWNGLGLEWRDRLVLVDDRAQEEPVLASILRSIGPAGPGARVRGWATSALLPSSGSFSPARELQLLVVDVARRRPASLQHLPAHATGAGFDGERVDLPPAARAWERLKSLGGSDMDIAEAVGPLRWSPDNLDRAPADVIVPGAGEALRRLTGGSAQMRFVLDLARPRGDALDGDFGAAARVLFGQLVGRPALEPQHAAFYIKALADGPAAAANAMAPVGADLLKPGTGRWLRGQSFARLLQLGYPQALAGRAEEAPLLLEGLGGDELALLLDTILSGSDESRRPPPLLSAIVRALGDRTGDSGPPAAWRAIVPAALGHRFEAPPGPDEHALGARGVVRAARHLSPQLLAPLARRALRLRDAEGPRVKLDMLGGALEWVRSHPRESGAAA